MYRRPTPIPATGAAPPPRGVSGPNVANPDLAASFLQAVAAQAAGGAAPSPSAPATQTISAPLLVSSNPASWANIVKTHRVVTAMFTSPGCAACRMIEPVFESLAEEKASPGVAFVKVDFAVGRGGEIAAQHGVSTTPTFLFILDGEVQGEVKGVNAPEIKSQIELMLYTAFPRKHSLMIVVVANHADQCRVAHPHLKQDLGTIRSLSTDPILFKQAPNFDAALTKFISFVDATSGVPNVGAVKSTISTSFVPFLKRRFGTPPVTSATPTATIAQWSSATLALVTAMPASQLFPLADFWRLAVLDLSVVTALTASPQVLSLLIGKAASALDAADSRNTALTVLRLATNALANDALARVLLPAASALLIPALLHSDARVRAAAASLAFNAAALVQRPLMSAARAGKRIPATSAAGDDFGGARDAEWEIEILSALVEALGQERESEDVVHRLSAALGMLLHLSPHFDEQDKAMLEVLQARQSLLVTLETCVKKPEVMTLVKEVAEQLCP